MTGSFSGVGSALISASLLKKAYSDAVNSGKEQEFLNSKQGKNYQLLKNKEDEDTRLYEESQRNGPGNDWWKIAALFAALPTLGASLGAGAAGAAGAASTATAALPLLPTLFGTKEGEKGVLSQDVPLANEASQALFGNTSGKKGILSNDMGGADLFSSLLGLAPGIISANTQSNALSKQLEQNQGLQKLMMDLQYGTNYSGQNPGGTGELDKSRSFQEKILDKQQGASSSESALSRALQEKLLGSQQEYGAGQSALERAQQEKMFGLQSGESEKGREFTAGENALTRALQERGLGLQEQQFASTEDQRKLAQASAQAGEQSFLDETSQENPAINQLIENIRTNKNRDIQESENQMRANLYKSGVRGSRGASLIGQQSGQLTENAMRDVNTLKSQADLDRQKTKQQYFANKALAGYGRS